MNFLLLAPELILLATTSVLLLLDAFLKDASRKLTYHLALGIVLLCFLSSLSLLDKDTAYTFHGMFVLDRLAHLLKLASYIAVAMTFFYSRAYLVDRDMVGQTLGGAFYPLTLFALLGQMIMISAANLLSLYLGLELMALSLYALVALRRDAVLATEAAMKYFILGALASGFLLYGMSMLYGATGSLNLTEITRIIAQGEINQPVLNLGLVFIVSGVAFKLGVAPFHRWVPDVYQGAPTAITLFLAGVSKLAAFAIIYRLVVETLLPLAEYWQPMLMLLAIASLLLGNIMAIAQTNLKRMLAYSAIAHMGFMLLALVSGVAEGDIDKATTAHSAALFYMLTYVFTTLGAFGVIAYLAHTGYEAENLEDFKGLHARHPWCAAVMLILMLSLAGIPPFVGFYAKFVVLQAVLEVRLFWLVVYAVLLSVIGAFYYLRLIKLMYFDAPPETAGVLEYHKPGKWILGVNGCMVLGFGLFPDGLLQMTRQTMLQTMANFLATIMG